MTVEQERRLASFLQSLSGIAWFAHAGRPSTQYQVAADAVVAWDDWNTSMMAVWPPRSTHLEDVATRLIGDAAIEELSSRVDDV